MLKGRTEAASYIENQTRAKKMYWWQTLWVGQQILHICSEISRCNSSLPGTDQGKCCVELPWGLKVAQPTNPWPCNSRENRQKGYNACSSIVLRDTLAVQHQVPHGKNTRVCISMYIANLEFSASRSLENYISIRSRLLLAISLNADKSNAQI